MRTGFRTEFVNTVIGAYAHAEIGNYAHSDANGTSSTAITDYEALTETITRDPAELEDALWISREDLLAAQSGERPGLMPARKGSIAHFLLTNWLADRLN